MATIQIRDIPDESYEVIRTRSRAAGRSIQSYMRELVMDFAARPSATEALAYMASRRGPGPGPSREEILSALDADRR
ncbi:MAG: antitoxin [Micrococcales bacterium]|nr:antitoxin [Micrococcales bacterium]